MEGVEFITPDEARFLKESLNSELMRVVRKVLNAYRNRISAKIELCRPEELLGIQGELRGARGAAAVIDATAEAAPPPEAIREVPGSDPNKPKELQRAPHKAPTP